MARFGDEHIFQTGLSQRQRLNLTAERFRQRSDPLRCACTRHSDLSINLFRIGRTSVEPVKYLGAAVV